eukprot:6244933-Prymnesium_polylepis.1
MAARIACVPPCFGVNDRPSCALCSLALRSAVRWSNCRYSRLPASVPSRAPTLGCSSMPASSHSQSAS